MTATTSPSRANRVASYFDESRKTLPPLPTTPEARHEALAGAVFAALFALQYQLTHPDPAVSLRAAVEILDFEKTRLRHGRDVAGTTPPPPDLTEVLKGMGVTPTEEAAEDEDDTEGEDDTQSEEEEDEDEAPDPFLIGGNPPKDYGKFVRDVYQALVAARELGFANFVTVFDAEKVAAAVVDQREAYAAGVDPDDPDDG